MFNVSFLNRLSIVIIGKSLWFKWNYMLQSMLLYVNNSLCFQSGRIPPPRHELFSYNHTACCELCFTQSAPSNQSESRTQQNCSIDIFVNCFAITVPKNASTGVYWNKNAHIFICLLKLFVWTSPICAGNKFSRPTFRH